jgi:ATP-dependent DNA helicase RecQ
MVIDHTGEGKAAIYRAAGTMLDGVTVVVSPLIALHNALERLKDGDFEYIGLAPEQLDKPETMAYLQESGVSLFVVDEAHCVVERGRDFRPEYLRIGPAIEHLGHPAVLALTAAASAPVREEIAQRLGMQSPAIFVSGFDRPNISLRVDHFKNDTDKLDAIVRRVGWADKPGIVYVATRRNADAIVKALDENGVDTILYHGGMTRKDRGAIQNRFMEGAAEVIVATNAFGMGIDRADVRFVYHYDLSASLDAYYQEVGRAGRDGEKAEAILFYRHENQGSQKFRASQGKLDVTEMEMVAQAVAQHEGQVPVEQVLEAVALPARKVEKAVQRLADSGVLEVGLNGAIALNGTADRSNAPQQAMDAQEQHEEAHREKLEQMQQYAESKTCRRAILLSYFGEASQPLCGNCDNCEASLTTNAGTRREVV